MAKQLFVVSGLNERLLVQTGFFGVEAVTAQGDGYCYMVVEARAATEPAASAAHPGVEIAPLTPPPASPPSPILGKGDEIPPIDIQFLLVAGLPPEWSNDKFDSLTSQSGLLTFADLADKLDGASPDTPMILWLRPNE